MSPTEADPCPEAIDLINRGALVVCNHSGGKDSQAMLLALRQVVPANQLLVVHADLGGMVWEGEEAHIRDTTPAGVPILIAKAGKTLLEMVERRAEALIAQGSDASPWPSPSTRQCTSDLKRGPIEREIRRYIKAHNLNGLVLNCMGLRADESPNRAKAQTFKRSERNSIAGRDWYDWLPIHSWTEEEVFEEIAFWGQSPHWCYSEGMSRCSCCFCVMASKADLAQAARMNPRLYRRYVELEQATGKTMSMSRKTLEEVTGITVAQAYEHNQRTNQIQLAPVQARCCPCWE